MTLLSTIGLKIYRMAQMLNHPVLISLRSRGVAGGMLDEFQKLNQPWMKTLNLATVLDIGANTGQFAAMLNAILPEARIYSFEPLTDCFERLQTNMRGARNFTAFNIGLGEQFAHLFFERNASTASSSFLTMTEAHKVAFPDTRASQPISVRVERLDDMAAQITIIDPLLIKIDVQGYEDRVLRGGEQTIKRAKLIIIETSFEKLYEGQPLFDDVYRVLIDWGFTYLGSLGQLSDPRSGRTLQEDSIFMKSSTNADAVARILSA